MYPLMLCFLHSTHLSLGLVLEAGPVKTPIVFFGGESIAGNRWTESATYRPWRYTEICGWREKATLNKSWLHSKIIHHVQKDSIHMLSTTVNKGPRRPQWVLCQPLLLLPKILYLFIYVLIGAAVHKQRVKSGREPQVPWEKSATRHKPERNSTSRQSQASRKEFGINDLESCTAVMASHFNIYS